MDVVGEFCRCFSSATVLSVGLTSTCSSAFTDSVEKLVKATPAARARVIFFLLFLLFLDFIFTHIKFEAYLPQIQALLIILQTLSLYHFYLLL